VSIVAIVRATPADTDLVANLIGQAFHSLAVAEWLVADPVEHALAHGVIEMTTDHNAVAVWFPTGYTPMPPPIDYDERLAAACGPFTDRFRILDEQFDAHHPHDRPHHHLAFLATRPDAQCRGLGSALLRHHHRQLDTTNMAAYLEASSPRSRALYERHGYRTLGQPFTLPDGPPLWPMEREHQSR
jgi:ribosomal protein S18 acetylase RimI-like enzyme